MPGIQRIGEVHDKGLPDMRDAEKARRVKDALLDELRWLDIDVGSVSPLTSTYRKMMARRVYLENELEKFNKTK